MTNQEKFRKSFRYWLWRQLWTKAGRFSRWAGSKIVAGSRAAEDLDYPPNKVYTESQNETKGSGE